ncbi:MAG: hypothetical protein NZV14_00785 [Bryobacteraceae bacterium]|nr:hypothetical protein [Bryobacteraceae bacterium]MDW8376665.1 hypothetical protein [Bryobacterales bacterium]
MSIALIALWFASPLFAQHRLYTTGITSKGWVVGTKLQPSGLFLRMGKGWHRLGFLHPQIQTLDYDPRDPRRIYLAAGNGCIRSDDGGKSWRILTGWEMTELQDVSVDRNQPDHVWIALPDGVAVSRDAGKSWSRVNLGVARRFIQSIRVDRSQPGRVLAGGELGVLISEDAGASWNRSSPELRLVTHLEQSPHDAKRWLATTQEQGAYQSTDGGRSWQPLPGVPKGTLYNASFDPHGENRMALAGWGVGVVVSEDGGKSWRDGAQGLPSRAVWRAVFDPDQAGALWVSVHEEAAFLSPDAGRSWRRAGLEGSILYDFIFVPETAP